MAKTLRWHNYNPGIRTDYFGLFLSGWLQLLEQQKMWIGGWLWCQIWTNISSILTNIFPILTNIFINFEMVGGRRRGECASAVPTCWIKFWIWILEELEAFLMQIWRAFRWKIKISDMFQNMFSFSKGLTDPEQRFGKRLRCSSKEYGCIEHTTDKGKYVYFHIILWWFFWF